MTENERLLLEIDRDIALCQKELVSINNIVHMHKKHSYLFMIAR